MRGLFGFVLRFLVWVLFHALSLFIWLGALLILLDGGDIVSAIVASILAYIWWRIGGWLIKNLKKSSLYGSGSDKFSNFLVRLGFQLSPNILVPTFFFALTRFVVYGVLFALNIFPVWGIATLLGASNALSWALFINFLLYAVFSVLFLFVGRKRNLNIENLFNILETASARGQESNRLGHKLVAEALVRNFVIVDLLFAISTVVFTSAASAWSFQSLFETKIILGEVQTFAAYLSFFFNAVVQFLLLEIPEVFEIHFSPYKLNEASSMAALFIIFTRVVVVGRLVDLIVNAISQLQKIYVSVDETIDSTDFKGSSYSGIEKAQLMSAVPVTMSYSQSVLNPLSVQVGAKNT